MLASWECAVLWPDRCEMYKTDDCRIDHMVSLGTGSMSTPKHELGPHTPKRDRFIQRLFGSFMDQLDGEKQWKTFIRCIPHELQHRFHRLNVPLRGVEPALDDTEAIEHLKEDTLYSLERNDQLHTIENTMVASIFYFELDTIDRLEGGTLRCSGTIFCRLSLEAASRHVLHEWLKKNAACFVLGTQSIPCVSGPGRSFFRRSVSFIATNLDEQLSITLTGVTNTPTLISGMPVRLRSISDLLYINSPFGFIDSRRMEKSLPEEPAKRKADRL